MANDDETADPEAVAEVLRGFLVRCGNPESRTVLASRLVREGITLPRLTLICETMAGRGKPEAETAAFIGQVLKTRESWLQFVEDVEYAIAHARARGGPTRRRKGDPPMVNMVADLMAQRASQRKQLEEYVRERINVDGKSALFVAEHLSISIQEVQRILGGST